MNLSALRMGLGLNPPGDPAHPSAPYWSKNKNKTSAVAGLVVNQLTMWMAVRSYMLPVAKLYPDCPDQTY